MTGKRGDSLPKEVTTPVQRRGILISVLGTVVFVLILNGAASWYLKEYTDNWSTVMIRDKWERLLHLEQPVDCLILGDSGGLYAVVPSILQEQLGITAVNLSIMSRMLILNDVWMLDTYIRRHGPPKQVLIVHADKIWDQGIHPATLADIPLGWGYWRQMDPPLELTFSEKLQLFLVRHVPLYARNRSLWERLKSPTRFSRMDKRLDESGWLNFHKAIPRVVEDRCQLRLDYIREHEFLVSSLNREALQRLVALTRQHAIEVYWVTGPYYEGLYGNEEFRAYYQNIVRTVEALADRNEHIHYIFREPMTFSKHEMQNPYHLIDSSARIYTNRLVAELTRLQSAGE